VSVSSKRDSECSCQTEICEFEVSFFVDQEVLGFQVSVQDSMRVEVIDSFD